MLNDVILEGIIVKSWKYADDLLFRLVCYRDPDMPQKAPGDVHDAADYVCSDCWGHLVLFPNPKTRLVEARCTTEGCACSSYVTKIFAEWRKQEQAGEYAKARASLRGVLDWADPEPRRPVAQTLQELGFG